MHHVELDRNLQTIIKCDSKLSKFQFSPSYKNTNTNNIIKPRKETKYKLWSSMFQADAASPGVLICVLFEKNQYTTLSKNCLHKCQFYLELIR